MQFPIQLGSPSFQGSSPAQSTSTLPHGRASSLHILMGNITSSPCKFLHTATHNTTVHFPQSKGHKRESRRALPPVLPWRPGAFGAPWTQPPGRDPVASFATTLLSFHWGGEEGGPICQICKKGGKMVFSQENTGRKGARASCPDQNGFRDY